jgi:hypothetical protein
VSGATPLAGVSLDLDDRWVYLRTRGEPAWASAPSYLETVAQRALALLGKTGPRITCFAVGRDAAAGAGREAVAALAATGHEIGSHAHSHDALGARAGRARIADEIARAQEAVHAAAGCRPVGFRGPGYALSPAVLEVLAARAYRYDATLWPTWVGAVVRRAFMRAHPDRDGAAAELFGSADRTLLPNRPFRWSTAAGELVELPVTAVPLGRLPLQASLLTALRTLAPPLSRQYLRLALALCRRLAVEPSLILHPPDLLGAEDAPDLAFFPAMRRPAAWKAAAVAELLAAVGRHHRVVTLAEHAEAVAARPGVALVPAARLDARDAAAAEAA